MISLSVINGRPLAWAGRSRFDMSPKGLQLYWLQPFFIAGGMPGKSCLSFGAARFFLIN